MTKSECPLEILHRLSTSNSSDGLEFHPFSIGWYNDQVSSHFQLSYPYKTLAFCIISKPNFFDDVFVPCLHNETEVDSKRDPFDQFITSKLAELRTLFPDHHIDIIQDFELHPSRKPKILVQTAGHVSGAAYYYQKSDVENQPWGERKICGVSLHPKYSGWFAFRGVLIFSDVQVQMDKKQPLDKLIREEKIKLLEGFNFHWKEWWFRDIATPESKYSENQKKYFSTKPADRFDLMKGYLKK